MLFSIAFFSKKIGHAYQENWFQVATARNLKGLRISDRGIGTVGNVGFTAHPVIINNACKEASASHLSSVQQTTNGANENENLIMKYLDDYHDIHSHHPPTPPIPLMKQHVCEHY